MYTVTCWTPLSWQTKAIERKGMKSICWPSYNDDIEKSHICKLQDRVPCCGDQVSQKSEAKKLRPSKTREVKVDMLVYNREYGDVFVCEDKPEHAPDPEVKTDTTGSQQLAENRLANRLENYYKAKA